MRAAAWASTMGFHWGSMICTYVAAVRFKLLYVSRPVSTLKGTNNHEYPVEPHPVDSSIILIIGSVWNLSILIALSSSD